MKLEDLLLEFSDLRTFPDKVVGNIQHDVQCCDNQSLLFYFLSHKGHKQEHDYYTEIREAINRNVVAIVLDINDVFYDIRDIQRQFSSDICLIPVVELYKKISFIAAKFYEYPSEKLNIIGTTGTNGKTSISHFIAQSMDMLGHKSAVIGSIGYGVWGQNLTRSEWTDYRRGYTTPHPIDLQKILAEFVKQGVQFVSMEITSHSLIWYSLLSTKISAVIFTNVSEDHFEYHGTRYSYAEAKRMIFDPTSWSSIKRYIINVDDAIGYGIFKKLEKVQGIDVYAYSPHPKNDYSVDTKLPCIYAENISLGFERTKFDIRYNDTILKVRTPLVGSYYVDNILAVFGFLKAINVEDKKISYCLNNLTKISGRMEVFKKEGFPTTVVDFGHNPDGIEKTLSTLKGLTQGNLFCIFGCPGDNNTGTCHQMASVVESYADNIIITMSNPYSEDPDKILSELFARFTVQEKVKIVRSRADAILDAFNSATKHDVILITGKGSQQYIAIGNIKIPHSDIACVESIYRNKSCKIS